MIKFHKDLAAALKQASRVVLIASEKSYRNKDFEKIFEAHSALVEPLAPELKEISADTKGKKFDSYTTDKKLRQVRFACLPKSISRHNSPTRKQAIFELLSNLSGTGATAIVLVLEDAAHYAAAAGAIARHEKLYSRKTKKDKKDKSFHVLAMDEQLKLIPADPTVQATASGVSWAAKMLDMPPEELNPKSFSAEIKKWVKNDQVKFKEIAGAKLLDENLGGIHAVGSLRGRKP